MVGHMSASKRERVTSSDGNIALEEAEHRFQTGWECPSPQQDQMPNFAFEPSLLWGCWPQVMAQALAVGPVVRGCWSQVMAQALAAVPVMAGHRWGMATVWALVAGQGWAVARQGSAMRRQGSAIPRQGWVARQGSAMQRQGWVARQGSAMQRQGSAMQRQGWVSRQGSARPRQGWVARLGSARPRQGWVARQGLGLVLQILHGECAADMVHDLSSCVPIRLYRAGPLVGVHTALA